MGPTPHSSDLEEAFRLEVFKMLKKEEKITDNIIENMMGWHHSGFNIYCGERIWPSNSEGLKRLALPMCTLSSEKHYNLLREALAAFNIPRV